MSGKKDKILAEKVRMKRVAGSRKIYVLVEGRDDVGFYQKFFSRDEAKAMPGMGRDAVISALYVLKKAGITGVIGIIDADFDHVLGVTPECDNLFQTDSHDAETMAFFSDALSTVFDVLQLDIDEGKLQQIRCDIVTVATRLGALRFISKTQDLSIDFSDTPIEKFVKKSCLTFSWKNCLMVLQDRSGVGILPETLMPDAETVCSNTSQYPAEQMCCGHELVRLLSMALQKKHGEKKPAEVKHEILENSLRLAYSHREFQKSKLAQSIRAWETEYQMQVLKS